MIITNEKLNGRYVLERKLGEGGFGAVYLARDTRLHSRPVIIKTPLGAPDGAFDDPWLRRKFDEEIMALARIEHPGVVGVYDVGWMPQGAPFVVMPYVDGETLRGAMQGGVMELTRSAHIVSQLGFALSAAHAAGVIHRDLKPENVILRTFDGGQEFAFLIDFGIATVRDLQAGRREQRTQVVGTPPYMAPEQLCGEPAAASDVWALGVVAYEMVTGRLPFPASSFAELIDMQRSGVGTPPRALRPELPEAAQATILKALSSAPALRYAYAHEMGEAFQRAVRESQSAPAPPNEASPDYPAELRRRNAQPAPPPDELLQRCRELFEEFEEFRSTDTLLPLFRTAELSAYKHCVRRAAGLEFDHLLDCLYRSGRDYRGQALLDLLGLLASRYRHDYRGQECEGLRGSLRQLFAQAHAAGR